jgi:hypothetical protein
MTYLGQETALLRSPETQNAAVFELERIRNVRKGKRFAILYFTLLIKTRIPEKHYAQAHVNYYCNYLWRRSNAFNLHLQK